MMKSLAPVAFAGIATAVLWKILQILMAPVIAWIIGMFALGLKIGLAVAFACVLFYGLRKVMRSRAQGEDEVEA